MKKLFFLLGCLLLLSGSSVLAQEKAEVVTVRVEEQGYYLYVYTARSGSEQVERQELQTAKKEQPGALIVRTYQLVMTTYLNQGYTLQSLLTNRFGADNAINTFIFVRSPKP